MSSLGQLAQYRLQFSDVGRLVQNAIHTHGQLLFSLHRRGPAGHHDDGSGWRFLFYNLRQLATVEMGHSQIRDDHVEGSALLVGGAKSVQSDPATVGNLNLMTVAFENLLEQFPQ